MCVFCKGKSGGMSVWGLEIMTCAVIIVSIRMLMATNHWTKLYAFGVISGVLAFLSALFLIQSNVEISFETFHTAFYFLSSPNLLLLFVIQIVICILPGVIYNFIQRQWNANLPMILFEANKYNYHKSDNNNNNNNDGNEYSTLTIVSHYLNQKNCKCAC